MGKKSKQINLGIWTEDLKAKQPTNLLCSQCTENAHQELIQSSLSIADLKLRPFPQTASPVWLVFNTPKLTHAAGSRVQAHEDPCTSEVVLNSSQQKIQLQGGLKFFSWEERIKQLLHPANGEYSMLKYFCKGSLVL